MVRQFNGKIFKFPEEFPAFKIEIHSFKWNLVVPDDLRPVILKQLHDDALASHGSVNRTLARLRTRYTRLAMSRDIKDYFRKCEVCQTTKSSNKVLCNEKGKLKAPWKMVALDLVGPVPKTSHGNVYILIIMDVFRSLLYSTLFEQPCQPRKCIEQQVFFMFVCTPDESFQKSLQ